MNSFYGTRDWFLRKSGSPFKNFIAGNKWLTPKKWCYFTYSEDNTHKIVCVLFFCLYLYTLIK